MCHLNANCFWFCIVGHVANTLGYTCHQHRSMMSGGMFQIIFFFVELEISPTHKQVDKSCGTLTHRQHMPMMPGGEFKLYFYFVEMDMSPIH